MKTSKANCLIRLDKAAKILRYGKSLYTSLSPHIKLPTSIPMLHSNWKRRVCKRLWMFNLKKEKGIILTRGVMVLERVKYKVTGSSPKRLFPVRRKWRLWIVLSSFNPVIFVSVPMPFSARIKLKWLKGLFAESWAKKEKRNRGRSRVQSLYLRLIVWVCHSSTFTFEMYIIS